MKSKTIRIEHLRPLLLRRPTAKGRAAHVSAASGLVIVNRKVFVIADDEYHLSEFDLLQSERKGEIHRIFPGTLPKLATARKKQKPDMEALAFWPPVKVWPYGALVLLPSGSKENRDRGAVIPFTSQGKLERPLLIDFKLLWEELRTKIPNLNIEGLVIRKSSVRLFHRANGANSFSAVIHLDSKIFGKELRQHHVTKQCLKKVIQVDLGKLKGHALAFTDATAADAKYDYFIAVAEAGNSTYLDGKYLGAKLGLISKSGKVRWMKTLKIAQKPEGFALLPNKKKTFLVVTDADDPHHCANLLKIRL